MASNRSKSEELYERAKKLIPGGVNSPVRAFKSVGGRPVYIERAVGSRLYDADDLDYLDLMCSWGAMILGHANSIVVDKVSQALKLGTSFGACSELEIKMAEKLVSALSSVEQVRMVNSGTEAVMSATRLARGFTGKKKIIKFDGCYHGHYDPLLVKAGSGLAGESDSSGVLDSVVADTVSLPYNNLESVEKYVKEQVDIAAIIVEPVAGNMGVVPPAGGFLQALRELTTEYDILLIFDEVITGFRLCYGGAQDYSNVKPDLCCLGKIIGGGFPVGAFAGSAEIMSMLAPDGPVYQAGTLSGNPIALTAGLATLECLENPKVYSELNKKTKKLEDGLIQSAQDNGVDVCVNRVESMLSVFFTSQTVSDYESAKSSDAVAFRKFFKKMLAAGVYLPPSRFESWFISTAHSEKDMEFIINAIHKSF